jgi:hypothetical protein
MGTGKSRVEIPRDKTRRYFSRFRHCVRGILSLSLSLSLSLHHQQFLFEINFFDHQFFSPTFSFSNSEFME